MHICYDSQIFALQNYGGISRYFYELATRLAKHPGIETTIVAPVHINSYVKGDARVRGIAVPAIPKTTRIRQAINRALAPSIYRISRPDVVHETYYQSRAFVPAGCATVVTVYDMIHEKFPEMFPLQDRTSEQKRKSVARADRVICISEQTREDLMGLFNTPSQKISVVHLGVTLRENCRAPTLNSENESQKAYILYVGQRKGYKNFVNVLRAYAHSLRLRHSFNLLCFGGGRFDSAERELMRALKLAPEQVVQLSGDDKLLSLLYRNAAAFVYPSLYEGFGMPPLEAMSFGCPVACSDVPPITQVVGDAAAAFDPKSPDAICSTLEALMDSDERRRQLISGGKERVKLFSWDRCAQETALVYRTLNA